tara:strand:- start:138 stop:527 length:390 start_codon:yes stop_codon:yes gene_type:complete
MADKKERAWYADKLGKIGIVEKSVNKITKDGHTSDWTSITEAKTFRIYAISRDDDLTASDFTNTFNQIPAEFHEAIVYKVIANGYKDTRNQKFEAAQYFDKEYVASVKEAKKFSKANYTTTGFIKPQDY